MTVAVVVPVHNAEETLAAQLEALCDQINAPPFEVIVALNRCSDESLLIARRYATRLDVTIVEANERPGPAHARNAGVRVTRAERILHCDADDIVDSKWVGAMVRSLDEFDLVGGRIELLEPHPAWADSSLVFGLEELPSARGLRFAPGGAVGYRRWVFTATGGFPEQLLTCQDVAFSILAQRCGARIGYCSDGVVRCRVRSSAGAVLRQRFRWGNGESRLQAEIRPMECRSAVVDLTALVLSLGRQFLSFAAHPSVTSAAGISRSLGRISGLVALWRHGAWSSPPESVGFRDLALLRTATAINSIKTTRTYGAAKRRWTERCRVAPAEVTLDPALPLVGGLLVEAPRTTAQLLAQHDACEPLSLRALHSVVRHGDVVIDIGANIGLFTLAALRAVGPSGEVRAFEPQHDQRTFLHSNIERHRVGASVTIHGEALGRENGTARFYLASVPLASGLQPTTLPGVSSDETTVDVRRLDSFGLPAVRLVKIDVEGFEMAVLDGARHLLENTDVALLVELNPAALAAQDLTADDLLNHPAVESRNVLILDDCRKSPTFGELMSPADYLRCLEENRALIGSYVNVLAVPHSWISVPGALRS